MRLKELLRKYIYALLNKIRDYLAFFLCQFSRIQLHFHLHLEKPLYFESMVDFGLLFSLLVPINLAPFAPVTDAPSMKNASLTLITVLSENTLTWLEIAKRHVAVFPHQLQVFPNVTPRTTSVVKISE